MYDDRNIFGVLWPRDDAVSDVPNEHVEASNDNHRFKTTDRSLSQKEICRQVHSDEKA